MTDKELFEKVEEKFNLKEKTKLSKVFEKGNFNKAILEIRQSRAPSGLGGAIGSTLKYFSPTQFKTRAAQARKEKALARQEELKADQLEKELATGKPGDPSQMDEFLKKQYNGNPQFRAAYDAAAAGRDLTASQQRVYNAGLKKAEAERKGKAGAEQEKAKKAQQEKDAKAEAERAEKEQQQLKELEKEYLAKMDGALKVVYTSDPEFKAAFEKVALKKKLTAKEKQVYDAGIKKAEALRQEKAKKEGEFDAQSQIETKAGENRLKKLGRSAPEITKFLVDPKNEAIKKEFIKYMLQSPTIGIPTETEIVQLAKKLEEPILNNQTEIANFKRFVRNEPNLQDDGQSLIKLLPATPKRQAKSGTKKKIILKPQTVDMFLKKGAEADKRTLEGQKEEMIRQAKKYKVGNTVLGKGGAQLQIKDISSINGLITLKDMNNRTIYRFANGLGEVLERGGSQVDLGPDLKGESFEYIVKKYR